ncbi:hypothetical protein [Nannocystis pusilla]|uniref:hypothetical protein n=1 Tax=Nannocystis pusilla TaxID=889268 RepID=UPI003B7F1A4C
MPMPPVSPGRHTPPVVMPVLSVPGPVVVSVVAVLVVVVSVLAVVESVVVEVVGPIVVVVGATVVDIVMPFDIDPPLPSLSVAVPPVVGVVPVGLAVGSTVPCVIVPEALAVALPLSPQPASPAATESASHRLYVEVMRRLCGRTGDPAAPAPWFLAIIFEWILSCRAPRKPPVCSGASEDNPAARPRARGEARAGPGAGAQACLSEPVAGIVSRRASRARPGARAERARASGRAAAISRAAAAVARRGQARVML